MTNTFLLEEHLDRKGYKKGFIAKTLGITPNALRRKMTNKSEFKSSEVKALSELLDLTFEEIREIFFN